LIAPFLVPVPAARALDQTPASEPPVHWILPARRVYRCFAHPFQAVGEGFFGALFVAGWLLVLASIAALVLL